TSAGGAAVRPHEQAAEPRRQVLVTGQVVHEQAHRAEQLAAVGEGNEGRRDAGRGGVGAEVGGPGLETPAGIGGRPFRLMPAGEGLAELGPVCERYDFHDRSPASVWYDEGDTPEECSR